MALKQYGAKRDFRKTPEPEAKPGKPHRRPIFVVQEHWATRHHFDFRLEADGVLKSWAVPKGPSMDPAQKRLAVHVEDHPLAYAEFKGTIPEGEYGAGAVAIWDKGTYENLLADKPQPLTVTEGIQTGRLEFTLHGKKLRGRFALVRMQGKARGKDNWLVIKMKDEFARPETSEDGRSSHQEKANSRLPAPGSDTRRSISKAPARVAFTNVDKIMYPDAGITKGDVLDFYLRISEHLLPFLRGRPATLERLPEGLGHDGKTPHFWQKNTPRFYPDWIPRAELPTGQGGKVRCVLVNDPQTLLYLVNQGTLTFHVWFSRMDDLDRPDFVLFDLDPGRASFADVVAITLELHAILKAEAHDAFVKTSGKTGLHVLVPWTDDGGYDEARAWALDVAGEVVKALPDQATTERSKTKRGQRLYIDVMQNAKGRHVVPPYVLRPVAGATVSTPLHWREVTPALDPSQFNLKTIFRRLAQQKHDPMTELLGARRRAT